MKILGINDYNERVSAIIAKVCIDAYERYDKEREGGQSERVAMARAIGDSIKENIIIHQDGFSLDREMLARGYGNKEDFIKHMEDKVFYSFAKTLRDSMQYRVESFNNFYETVYKYELATFKLPLVVKNEL